jgi:hypothetical protein
MQEWRTSENARSSSNVTGVAGFSITIIDTIIQYMVYNCVYYCDTRSLSDAGVENFRKREEFFKRNGGSGF